MALLCCFCGVCFFFKQKTAYEMRISDWSSDVCSSDLERQIIFLEGLEKIIPADPFEVFVLLAAGIVEIDPKDAAALLAPRRIDPRGMSVPLFNPFADVVMVRRFCRAGHRSSSSELSSPMQ